MIRTIITLVTILLSIPAIAQTYNMDDVNGMTINTCSGTFLDSDALNFGTADFYYNNGENYQVTFCSSIPGNAIQFNFDYIQTVGTEDTLWVYNGTNSLSTPIAIFAGGFSNQTVTGFSGCLTFKFKSTGTSVSIGWDAAISCINIPPVPLQPGCTNVGFESGNFTGWYGTYGTPLPPNNGTGYTNPYSNPPNPPSITVGPVGAPHPTYTPNVYGSTASPQHTIMTGAGLDPFGLFPVVNPNGGTTSMRLGDFAVGGYEGASIEQKFSVTAANATMVYSYAVVIQDASAFNPHLTNDQPFFRIEALDCAGNPIACGDYLVVGGPGIPGFTQAAGNPGVYYKTWTDVFLDLTPYIGSCVTVRFTQGDCALGAHYSYVYLDAVCAPLQILAPPSICQNTTDTLVAPAGGASYSWVNLANPLVVIGTTDELIVTPTTPGIVNYQCTITSVTGCNTSLTATINVLATPTITITNPPAVCSPATVNITAGVATITAGSGAFSYWMNAACTIPLANPSAITTSGTYYIKILNANGCFDVEPVTVVVNTSPVTNITTSNQGICPGGSVNLNATVTPAATNTPVTFSNTTSFPIPGSTPIISPITVSGINPQTPGVLPIVSVCVNLVHTWDADLDIYLQCPNGTQIALSTGNGGSGDNYTNTCFVPSGTPITSGVAPFTGNFTPEQAFTMLNACAVNGTWSLVVSDSDPAFDLGSLSNWSITFNNYTPAPTYVWTPTVNMTNSTTLTPTVSPTVTTSYTLTSTSASGGCTSNDLVTITVNPIPTATVNSSVICAGATATVTATPGIAGTYSYAWTVPVGVPNPGNVASFTTTVGGTYSVVLTNTTTMCVGVGTPGTVTVNPLPTASVNSSSICAGATATVTATPGAAGTYSYVWTVPVGVPNPGNVNTFTTSVAGTYSVVLTNTTTLCVSSIVSGTVTFNPVPTATVNSPVVCAGSLATLTATPGAAGTYSYAWTVPGGVANPGNVASFTTTIAGTYSVVLTNTTTLCVGASASGTVTLNPLPTATVNNSVICAGATATVTATPGTPGTYSYVWTVPGGVSNPGNVASFTTTVGGTYSVVITNTITLCAGATASGTVTINPLPTASVNNSSICVGATATITATPGAAGTYSYVWTVPGGVPNPGNVASFTTTIAGTYSVVLTNTTTLCVGASASGTVTFSPVPTATVNSPVVCAGALATVTATPGVAGTYSYVWTVPGGFANPGNVASFTTTVTGTYSVVLTNTTTLCVGASASGTVTLNPSPTATVNSSSVCLGTSATVTATPDVAGTYSYAWTVPIGAANPGNVATFTTAVAGTYSVILTNTTTLCSGVAATGTVTVNPGVAGIVSSSVICVGETATVTATPGAPGTYDYTWTVPIGVPNPGNVATFTTTIAGNYSVVLTNTTTFCVSASSSGTVTLNPLPTATISNVAICDGDIATITAIPSAAGTYSYAWTVPIGATNPGNVASLTTTTAGTYSVILTNTTTLCVGGSASGTVTINPLPTTTVNSAIICAGSSASITATPGVPGSYSYAWTVPGGAVNPGNVSSFSATVAGTYSVIITNTSTLCVSASAAGTLTVNPLPTATVNSPVICAGETATITATPGVAGSYNYSWTVPAGATNPGNVSTFTVTVAGTYSVVLTNTTTLCTSASVAGTLTVNPLPNVFAGNDVVVCEGDLVVLNASGALTYLWSGGVTNGQSFLPTSSGTYTVTGTNANGCVNVDDVNVTIEPIPVVSFVADVTSGCEPLEVTFTNTSTGNGADCIWTFGNGVTINGCGPITTTFPNGGLYDVTLTTSTANGCTASDTYIDYIYVEDAPNAAFMPSSSVVSILNSQILFDNNSTGAVSYVWDFGDGSATSTVVNPLHVFPGDEAGTYVIELIAYSELGCPDTAWHTLIVNEELIFYVPNSFTPDNDDFNETFNVVFSSGYDPFDFNLFIFNRWGEIVWESHDVSVGWNATYGVDGTPVQDGTYTWKIDFKTTLNDERILVVGHVNVLR